MRSYSYLLLAILHVSTASSSLLAQQFQHVATFRPSDSEPGDFFGSLVDLSNDMAIVRSRTTFGGSAADVQTHVFEQAATGEWSETGIVRLPESLRPAATEAYFVGTEAAVDEGEIVFSSIFGMRALSALTPLHTQFARNTSSGWALDFRIYEGVRDPFFSERYSKSLFTGRSVAISGGTALSGDPIADFDRTSSGHPLGGVHVFEQDGHGQWDWNAVLLPEVPSENLGLGAIQKVTAFGFSVAIENDLAVVSAAINGGHRDPNQLYFFERNADDQWVQTGVVTTDKVRKVSPIEISGGTVVTRGYDDGAGVFTKNAQGEWEESFAFDSYDFGDVGYARYKIAIEDDLLAMTVPGEDDVLAVEVFQRTSDNQWESFDLLTSPEAATAGSFGSSLSFDGGRLLVGAGHDDFSPADPPAPPGAAYLFALVPEPTSVALLLCTGFAYSVWRPRAIRRKIG